jgi:hypothetical protein
MDKTLFLRLLARLDGYIIDFYACNDLWILITPEGEESKLSSLKACTIRLPDYFGNPYELDRLTKKLNKTLFQKRLYLYHLLTDLGFNRNTGDFYDEAGCVTDTSVDLLWSVATASPEEKIAALLNTHHKGTQGDGLLKS